MAKKTEETNEVKDETLDFPTDNAEQPELTIEQRLENIEKSAASIVAVNNMGQAINNIANVVEKLDLRTKLLEQQGGDFTERLANRVVEKMVEYDNKSE